MTRCARCHRKIKATITIGGYAYGPKCAAIMGIVPVKTSPQANQKHGLIHRATHRIKTAGMAFYRKWRNAITPGQRDLFDEVQK